MFLYLDWTVQRKEEAPWKSHLTVMQYRVYKQHLTLVKYELTGGNPGSAISIVYHDSSSNDTTS